MTHTDGGVPLEDWLRSLVPADPDRAGRFLISVGEPRSPARFSLFTDLVFRAVEFADDPELLEVFRELLVAELGEWHSSEFAENLGNWIRARSGSVAAYSHSARAFGLRLLSIWASSHVGSDEPNMQSATDDSALLVADGYSRYVLQRPIPKDAHVRVSPEEFRWQLESIVEDIDPDVVVDSLSSWFVALDRLGWGPRTGQIIVESFGDAVAPIPELVVPYRPGEQGSLPYRMKLLGWWLRFFDPDHEDYRNPTATTWLELDLRRAEAAISTVLRESLRCPGESWHDFDAYTWGYWFYGLKHALRLHATDGLRLLSPDEVVAGLEFVSTIMVLNPAAITRVLRQAVASESTDPPAGSSGGIEVVQAPTPSGPVELADDADPFSTPHRSSMRERGAIPSRFLSFDAQESGTAEAPSWVPDVPHYESIESLKSWLPSAVVYLSIYDLPESREFAVVAALRTDRGVQSRLFVRLGDRLEVGALQSNLDDQTLQAWLDSSATGSERPDASALIEDIFVVREQQQRRQMGGVGPLIDEAVDWVRMIRGPRARPFDCVVAARGLGSMAMGALLGDRIRLLDVAASVTWVPSAGLARGAWGKAAGLPLLPQVPALACLGFENEGDGSTEIDGIGNRRMFHRLSESRLLDPLPQVTLLTAALSPLATCATAAYAFDRADVAILAGHGRSAGANMGVQLADGVFPGRERCGGGAPVEIYASCFGLRWGQRDKYVDVLSPVTDQFTLDRVLGSDRVALVVGFADRIEFGSAGEIAVELAEAAVEGRSPFDVARAVQRSIRQLLAKNNLASADCLRRARGLTLPTEDALRLDALLACRVAGFLPGLGLPASPIAT